MRKIVNFTFIDDSSQRNLIHEYLAEVCQINLLASCQILNTIQQDIGASIVMTSQDIIAMTHLLVRGIFGSTD